MNTNTPSRKVIVQIRHACDGTLLHRPVRALAAPRRARAAAREAARREALRSRREARFQLLGAAIMGTVAILFVAALAAATVSDATGAAPRLNHGLAAIGRFVGGLMSSLS